MYSDLNGDYIFRQLKSDGSVIEVNVNRENILWQNMEACLERISLNLPDEEVIDLDEINEEENSNINEPDKKIELISKDNAEDELKTDLLSSLFHELLTPVNVILGFVQEIIDSVDEPTEEQKESAQIIKDNQQILLQTMNTAVQFTKLDENKIKLNIEEFDINKYLVDLQDSFSREADKENISVVFEKIPDSLLLKHDRSKLLAAISFLVKFVIKLTNSSKIFISFQVIEKQLFLIVKDNDNEISETVSSDILEIFNKPFLIKKKNYGISPITIRLANKLNELLSVKVIEYSNSENFKTIALVTPVNIENSISASVTETSLEEIETTETKLEEVKEEITEEEILTESLSEIEEEIETLETPLEEVKEEFLEDGIVTNTNPTVEDEIVSEPTEDIANGEVDNKIIEDIEEEEEIITEEIATIEKNGHDNLNLSNLSCLFIDDSVDSQLLFKSQMNDFKLLKVSHNFSEALPLLNKYKFDLIIVDIHLNDTYNGLDVLKIVRQFENYKAIPIIAVTAYPFEGDREKFITFGFSNYFVKPLLREQILNSLEQILT
jgi:CheY-like chemotaxis protein